MCILCKVKLLPGKKALMHFSLSTTSMMSAAEKQDNTRQSGFFLSFITEKALHKLKSKATPHTASFRSPCTVSRLCKHTAPMQDEEKKKRKAPVACRNIRRIAH